MGYPPQGYGDKSREVWEYLTRVLTNLPDSRAELIDLIPTVEHETEWITNPNVNSVSSAAEEELTEGDMGTITYPSGATEVRVMLIPIIKAANQSVNTHHIGIKVQYSEDDGVWTNIIDLTTDPPGPPMGLVALDGAGDAWVHPLNVSNIVESGRKYEFRFVVDSDDANEVHYTTSFVLVLVYKME